MSHTTDHGSNTMMVALIAVLVIIALGFVALQVLPAGTNDVGSEIDVDVENPIDDGMTGNYDIGE